MKVDEVEVVSAASGSSVVLSSRGRRPVVLTLTKELTFIAAGKLLASCAALDPGQVFAMLREVSSRMPGQVPIPAGPEASSPGPSQEPRDDFFLEDFLDIAVELQKRAASRDIDSSLLPVLLSTLLSWRGQTRDRVVRALDALAVDREQALAAVEEASESQAQDDGGDRG